MATSSNTSSTKVNNMFSKPRYDQSTFSGRLRHFVDMTDPRLMFVSEEELNNSVKMLKDYEQTGVIPNNDPETLWRAKKVTGAIIHPDTHEKIPLPLRGSTFVPMNVLIAAGMLTPGASIWTQVFWQWVNQSYNTMFNHANRNASNKMTNEDVLKSYSAAVAVSCGAAVGFNAGFKRATFLSEKSRTILQLFVPFFAVAAANYSNVLLMRWNERQLGIDVFDDDGEVRGKSRVAGSAALNKVALSRVLIPVPVMTIPPVIFYALNSTSLFVKRPWLKTPMNLTLIAGCLAVGLPVAIAMFPQVETLPVAELEPEFQNLRDKSGNVVKQLYFNKGI
eukprot:TRINITY_DN5701_c0_g1_i1.p1 TRINITY_DN5701_c0_g1~~TRINITY_DN5701_c0_g1_i1.p1  ORF type:complete len:357 (-),score=77.77 TRINITY_DN5701_c0_g1_i1:111-1115(-)